MQRALDHLRANGQDAPDRLIAHLSPMSWQHIGLTGDYLWRDAAPATAAGERPLHDPHDRLFRVA